MVHPGMNSDGVAASFMLLLLNLGRGPYAVPASGVFPADIRRWLRTRQVVARGSRPRVAATLSYRDRNQTLFQSRYDDTIADRTCQRLSRLATFS